MSDRDTGISDKDAGMSDEGGGVSAEPGGKRPRWMPGRSLVFSLAAATSFLLYLHRYTWNLIRPEIEAEYGLSNTQLEMLGSAFFFPYALGQIPGGVLCDLFGPHVFLVVVILAWSLLLPMHGWAGSFSALLAVRGGFGFAQAGCYPALSQVTRGWFSLGHRTRVQGWVASAFGRGGGAMASIVMGSFLMGYLALSWVAALVVLSVVGVAFAFLFLLLFRDPPEPAPRVSGAGKSVADDGSDAEDPVASSVTDEAVPPMTSGEGASGDGLSGDGTTGEASSDEGNRSVRAEPPRVLPFGVALRNRSYLVLLFQQTLNAGSDVVFALILGSYFRSLGVTTGGQLGVLISLPLWGGALGGIFGGYANDWALQRFSNRRWSRAAVAGTGLAIGGVLVLAAVAQSDPVAVAVSLMVARFFSDWNQPTVWGTCTDLGGRYSATVFGINNMAGNLGAFATPFGVGLLLDAFSTMQVIDGETVRQTDYVPGFALCGGMMLAAAACWLFIDCTRRIDPEPE